MSHLCWSCIGDVMSWADTATDHTEQGTRERLVAGCQGCMSRLTWSPYPRYLHARYQSFEIVPRRTIVATDNVICTPNIACVPRTSSIYTANSQHLTSCSAVQTTHRRHTYGRPTHTLHAPALLPHAQPPTLFQHLTQHRTAQPHYSCPLAPISYHTT
jgi:hypothetical protein